MRPTAGWLDALPVDRMLAEFSLWSADLGRLADEMARVDRHVDLYHIDVADGRFSPALLFFPDLTAVVRKLTTKPLHVHLMTSDEFSSPRSNNSRAPAPTSSPFTSRTATPTPRSH